MKNFRIYLVLITASFFFACSDDDTAIELKQDKLADISGSEKFSASFQVTGNLAVFGESPNLISFLGSIGNQTVPQNSVNATFTIKSSNPTDVFYFDLEKTNALSYDVEYPIGDWFNLDNGALEYFNIYVKFNETGERNIEVIVTNSLNTTINLNDYVTIN